jgi:hypothetical protein
MFQFEHHLPKSIGFLPFSDGATSFGQKGCLGNKKSASEALIV